MPTPRRDLTSSGWPLLEDDGGRPRQGSQTNSRRQVGDAVVNLSQRGADEVQSHRLLPPAGREERSPRDIGDPLIQRIGKQTAGRLAARKTQQEEHSPRRPGPGGTPGQASLQSLKEDVPLLAVGGAQVRDLRRQVASGNTLRVHYWAYWSVPTEPEAEEMLAIPRWLESPVKWHMLMQAMSKPSAQAAYLAQFKTKRDSGDPEDNPLIVAARFYRRQYDLDLSEKPPQNRKGWRSI